MEISRLASIVGVAGGPVAVNVGVNSLDDAVRTATLQLHYLGGGTFDLLDEASDVSIAPNASTDVDLEWNTSGYAVGVHPLFLSVLTPDLADTLDTVAFDVVLVSTEAVFVLVGSASATRGNVVGLVSKPSIVTPPVYPATATPTPSSTPTPTATPTTTPTATPTATATPTPTPTPTVTPPPHADAEIAGISSDPSSTAIQGQWVEISVTVLNNGNAEVAVPVKLSFPSPDKQPATVTLRVPANQTATANFTWKTRNYDVGVHTLRAELLLEKNVTTGLTESEITVRLQVPTTTASIESFSIDPQMPVVGEAVLVSVAVKNEGILPANIPVTLNFPSNNKQPETRKPRAEPGETVHANFTWRTGNYQPGNHEFRVEAPGAERTFTVNLAAPKVDFRVVEAYGSSPDVPIVQGDSIDVSALVANAGPQEGRATVLLRDAQRDRVMQSESVALQPHESQVVDFTWKTSRYDLGTYRLQIMVDAANDTNRGNDVSDLGVAAIVDDRDITIGYGASSPDARFLGMLAQPDLPSAPNFSIESISWTPEAPVVGDAVSIGVEIINHGTTAISVPITLHFPSEDKQPETRRPRIGGGDTATATFTWRTSNYEPGTHSFRLENAGGAETFSIDLLPPTVDFRVVEVYGPSPDAPIVQGDSIDLSALVTNAGPQEGRATVILQDAQRNRVMQSENVTLRARESEIVDLTWKTSRYDLGTYHLQVAVDAANDTNRGNDVSDLGVATIVDDRDTTIGYGGSSPDAQFLGRLTQPDLPTTPNFSIQAISWTPEEPVVGDAVSITVEIANYGTSPVSVPITLHFPSQDKQPETRRPRIGGSETATATFTWRTSRYQPGNHEFRVEVQGAERTFTVALSAPMVDFRVVETHRPSPDAPIVQGDSIDVSALVTNAGPQAGRATVLLRDAQRNRVMQSESVALQAHESQVVDFTWKTARYDLGTYRLQIMVDAANDTNRGNDVSDLGVATVVDDRDITIGYGGSSPDALFLGRLAQPDLPSGPNFSIESISWTPEEPVIGEAVSITVEIANHGTSAISVPITLHFPSEDKQPETRRPRIGGGDTARATFTWRTSRYPPGSHSFRVETANGNQTFSIDLLPQTVDFEVVEIHAPNPAYPIVKGDWVEVTAIVRNVGKYEGRATISLWDMTHHRLMYEDGISLKAGESGMVEFTWKTLRYELGEHRLQVEAEAEHDTDASNNHSGVAHTEILTNRDITLGFPDDYTGPRSSARNSQARIRTTGIAAKEIAVVGIEPVTTMSAQFAPVFENPGVGQATELLTQTGRQISPQDDSYAPSPFQCAQNQHVAIGSRSGGEQCPGVWALVR